MSASAARLFEDYPDLTPIDMKATLLDGSVTWLDPVPVKTIGVGVVQGGRSWNNPKPGTTKQNHSKAAGHDKGIVAPTGATWSVATWSGATWSGNGWG